MKINVKVVFETVGPLSQDAGMEFWGLGRFKAVGARKYELHVSGESESVHEALEAIENDARRIVAEDKRGGNVLHMLHIEAVVE